MNKAEIISSLPGFLNVVFDTSRIGNVKNTSFDLFTIVKEIFGISNSRMTLYVPEINLALSAFSIPEDRIIDLVTLFSTPILNYQYEKLNGRHFFTFF